MKILYVITKSNFGGAQRYVYELATAFAAQGHDVAVACGGNGALVEKLEAAQIQVCQVEGFQRDISILKEFRALKSLHSIVKEFEPDVIHTNSSKAGFIGALVGRIRHCRRIVFTAHGWPFREERSRAWKLMAWCGSYLTALLSHRVILVSHDDLLNTRMPGIRRKCTTIHTAVPTIDFLPRDQARSALFEPNTTMGHLQDTWLITNAELTPNKNHLTAIDAVLQYNQTHSQKIFYTLIGTGELQEELQEYVRDRGATDQFAFLGYVDDARRYLYAFDIFLLPSIKEGLPYAVLEAGAAEMPVIASRVGGIPEVVTDKKEGLLINPHESDSIEHALGDMIANPGTRTSYATALKLKVSATYTLPHMTEATLAVYTSH